MAGMRDVAMVVNTRTGSCRVFNATYGTRLARSLHDVQGLPHRLHRGVDFVADRFDFDWELVGKLVRLGYAPLEIPVIYNSRASTAEEGPLFP